MKLRPLRSRIAACLAAAALAACSPPVPGPPPEAEAEAQPAVPERTRAPEARAKARRAERRPDPGASADAAAQYRYIDERGKVRLAARLEDIPERQRSTASSLEPSGARAPARAPSDDEREVSTAEVTIYTTPSCGYCRAAIAHFERVGIDYVNHDVSSDEEAREEYLELTGGRRGVPVIVVGESWIQGWSQPEFDRLLASAR